MSIRILKIKTLRWYKGKAQYAMNYVGRVIGQQFSGDFLKEALSMVVLHMKFYVPINIFLRKIITKT